MPRAVLYFTGEAIEDDDNVGGLWEPLGSERVLAWEAQPRFS